MTEQQPKTQKDFLYFNKEDFSVKTLTALSTEDSTKWFIQKEGFCTIGVDIFTDIDSLRDKARTILTTQQARIYALTRAFEKI